METDLVEQSYVNLMVAHQAAIKGQIRFYIKNAHSAQEAFSRVTTALINSHAEYRPAEPFLGWALGIARRVALKVVSEDKLHMTPMEPRGVEALIDALDQLEVNGELELKKEALHVCMLKLPPHHHQLVSLYYFDECPTAEIARIFNRTVANVYVLCGRIRKALGVCITREIPRL